MAPLRGRGRRCVPPAVQGQRSAVWESETKAGFNLGGGMEYFLNRRPALKGEGRYHIIGNARGGQDPSGLALTGGVKAYF